MQTKRKVNWVFLLMFCCFVGLNTLTAGASTGLDQVLGPCIDDQAFAVIRLDITKLNLDAFVGQALSAVSEHSGPDTAKHLQDSLKNFQDLAGAQLNDLLKAGGRDVFVVFSMYDFPYFFVAVPVHSANDQARLHQQIQKIAKDFNAGDIELHVSDGLILVGLKRIIARLKTVSGVRSQALAAGFQACANTTAQVVLFPSSDQRRILAEMLPQIPSESGNINLTTLSKDLHWAALGLNGPPSISLNMTIQSPNAEGADRVLTFIEKLYALVGQNPEVREFMPKLDQILKLLTPRRYGKRLLLQVDSTAADTIINNFVAPSLLQAHAIATRIACGTNMSGIGKALLIYANDYNDQLPPDLETLISKAEMPAKGLVCPATMLKNSYIYRGASITTSDTPWMITVYEKSSNHGGGRNVLFLDSHVEWVPEERFQELIKRDNDYRREKGFPVLPAQ
ncbi:MAG TPA: H-X9-DG-CTERM domain-containing protein [Sedimentisphaerales bacterium]|nr:H-X9-DG-CTERM domain-containing protein [Sedimentisphaerales bacterium]